LSIAIPSGCFFLDTCIILSDILNEQSSRINKLKSDSSFHKIACHISDSVKDETYEKVRQTSDFLGSIVRETIRYHLEEIRNKNGIPLTNPMDSSDIKALEDLFTYYQNAIRTTSIGLSNPISLIEEWTISFLGEQFDKGAIITIDHFLTELVKKLLTLTSSIEDSYDDLVTFQKRYVTIKNIIVDSRIASSIENLGIHKPDSLHIASAISHQASTGQKVVFVTLDFHSILDKKDLLKEQANLLCCDPLYALYHLF